MNGFDVGIPERRGAPGPVRWHAADSKAGAPAYARPGLVTAMARGFGGKCPCCGKGALFSGWLRQCPACAVCRAPTGLARADDAPPYFVIFITAHIVIAAQVLTDIWFDLPLALEGALFLPLTLALCLGLLRPVKGATIGLMMQFGMVQPQVQEP